jgi:hypothetical protein
MLDDASLPRFNCFLTSGMLQPQPTHMRCGHGCARHEIERLVLVLYASKLVCPLLGLER